MCHHQQVKSITHRIVVCRKIPGGVVDIAFQIGSKQEGRKNVFFSHRLAVKSRIGNGHRKTAGYRIR